MTTEADQWSSWVEHTGGGRPRILEGKYLQAKFANGEVEEGRFETPVCRWPSSWHHDLISRLLYYPCIRWRYRKPDGFAMLERIADNPGKVGARRLVPADST